MTQQTLKQVSILTQLRPFVFCPPRAFTCARRTVISVIITMTAFASPLLASPKTLWIGTAATGAAEGVYQAQFDETTGLLTTPTRACALSRSSFIALSADQKLLLSVTEKTSINSQGMNQRLGHIASFQIGPDQSLSLINTQPAGGLGPCHVTLDETKRVAFLSNYHDGSLSSYKILPDGRLEGPVTNLQGNGFGPHPKRQLLAHVHSARVLPGNRHVAFCELGTDQVVVYAFNQDTAELTAHSSVKLPPGSGPRHMALHPTLPLAFVVNELNQSLSALSIDPIAGTLTALQTISSRPEGSPEIDALKLTSAEIRVHPNGRYVYTSTRDLTLKNGDYLSVFALGENNHLSLVEKYPVPASIPRGFHLSPNGRWLILAGQKSNNLFVLALDPDTGKLRPHAGPIPCPAPIGLNFGHP